MWKKIGVGHLEGREVLAGDGKAGQANGWSGGKIVVCLHDKDSDVE